MIDLTERLHDELNREADAFESSSDLPQRVGQRIRRRRRRNQVLTVAAVVVVALAAAGSLAALQDDPDHGGLVDIADDGGQTGRTTLDESTTTAGVTTTTVPASSTTTVGAEQGTTGSTPGTQPELPLEPAFEATTPLSRYGVGPIEAGMTIPEAEEAAGIDLTVDAAVWEGFGRACGVFRTPGSPHLFVAWTPDFVPGEPDDAVIQVVGVDLTVAGAVTVGGVGTGDTADAVRLTYGEPTRIDRLDAFAGELLLYEEGTVAYGFWIIDGVVSDIRSGHVTGFGDFEPCA